MVALPGIIAGVGENDSLWTPGLFVKASFAPIKVDPVPGGG